MLRHYPALGVLLAALLLLAGCTAPPPPLSAKDASASRATIWLLPMPDSAPGLQALVHPYTVEDIHRIELIPYLFDEDYAAHPLSRVTGEPTTADDPEMLKAEMSGEALDLKRPIALSGLRHQQMYRIVANAYSSSGELLSWPESSALHIAVEDDDRPPIFHRVPLRLKDVPFNGRMPLEIMLSDPENHVDHLLVSLYVVHDHGSYLQGSPFVLKRPDFPGLVTLLNLAAYQSYQVEVRARPRDPEAEDLAVETLSWTMENDDAPATRSVTLSLP